MFCVVLARRWAQIATQTHTSNYLHRFRIRSQMHTYTRTYIRRGMKNRWLKQRQMCDTDRQVDKTTFARGWESIYGEVVVILWFNNSIILPECKSLAARYLKATAALCISKTVLHIDLITQMVHLIEWILHNNYFSTHSHRIRLCDSVDVPISCSLAFGFSILGRIVLITIAKCTMTQTVSLTCSVNIYFSESTHAWVEHTEQHRKSVYNI